MRVMGSTVRKRAPENVFAELQSCVSTYSPKHIHLMDETLTLDKKNLMKLLDMMLENGLQKKITWDAQTRPDVSDYELFKKMKAAGCIWIGIGIEAGNEKILKASGKGTTIKQITNAVRMAKRAGLKTDGYFILGHPFETPRAAMDTINLATKLNTTMVTFGLMTPYPGTEIARMVKEGKGGYRLLSENWEDYNKNIGDSMELETLSIKQMKRLQVLGYLKFYLFNFRFIAGVQYIFRQRRLVPSILGKLLFNRAKESEAKI